MVSCRGVEPAAISAACCVTRGSTARIHWRSVSVSHSTGLLTLAFLRSSVILFRQRLEGVKNLLWNVERSSSFVATVILPLQPGGEELSDEQHWMPALSKIPNPSQQLFDQGGG